MPYLITMLYSKDFGPTIQYVNIALFGIIFQAGSQTMGMIMLAKNDAKVYTYSVLAFQIFFLFLNIIGYKYFGIFGLGITFSINMFLHLIGIQILNFYLYKIIFKIDFLKILGIVLFFASVANGIRYITPDYRIIIGLFLFVFSFCFSLIKIKSLLNIKSITKLLKSTINGKNKKDN
jgi:O-antigen/teichoic acid export membrane protein